MAEADAAGCDIRSHAIMDIPSGNSNLGELRFQYAIQKCAMDWPIGSKSTTGLYTCLVHRSKESEWAVAIQGEADQKGKAW